MSHTDQTLRRPETITNLDELRQAKLKAEANAAQDKIRVESNLNDIKKEGPRVLLKDVVLPIVGVGIAIYGISKLVNAVTHEDRGRDFYAEPDYEYEERDAPVHYATKAPRRRSGIGALFTTGNLMRLAPFAMQAAKFGVDYLEKNGTEVPEIVHSILNGGAAGEEETAA
ncbi:MAG: hypothetical protein AB8F78_08250 [Saprospiraceae bacterium]